MNAKKEPNVLQEEDRALNADELAQVTGGMITIKDKEDISGYSGSSSHFELEGGGKSGGPEEMHFPNNEYGLEEPTDPAKRLGY